MLFSLWHVQDSNSRALCSASARELRNGKKIEPGIRGKILGYDDSEIKAQKGQSPFTGNQLRSLRNR